MNVDDGLLVRARDWVAQDPDPQTRGQLSELVDAAVAGSSDAVSELTARFAGTLAFGTAGLRGELGAGPMAMNRVVVLRAAAGLVSYVLSEGGDSIVIGYDARHNSRRFALDTARVCTGAGLRALVLPRPLPTPVLAYAIRHLGASAGVMVTASHNPARDNGYKVYLGDGSQIVPPVDADIAARITAVGRVDELTLGDEGEVVGPELVEAYLGTVVTAADGATADVAFRVVYTPLHGVGGELFLTAVARAGMPVPAVVVEQAEPDPTFRTVAFPNPEEPGALDLAYATARAVDADLVLANDPDADRCAVAVPDASVDAGWRMLTGDEVGALLGEHLAAGAHDGVLASSLVSSSLLARIAERHGLQHVPTLTGFKWISRVPGLRYGYEEALGYCIDPTSVRDKDGISAALLLLRIARSLAAEGRTLGNALDDLARTYGLHATAPLSVRVDDVATIRAAMARLRSRPPTSLGGAAVVSVDDLEHPPPGALPPTEGLTLHLEGGDRVVVRPSGTEPKLKAYLEVVLPVADSDDVSELRRRAAARLAAISADVRAAIGL